MSLVKIVPCDLLARECLCVNHGGGGRHACFDKCGLPVSQVESCSQRPVEVLSYRQCVSTQLCYTQKSTQNWGRERSYSHQGIPSCTCGWVHFLGSDWSLAQEWLYQHKYIPARLVWSVLFFICQLDAKLRLLSRYVLLLLLFAWAVTSTIFSFFAFYFERFKLKPLLTFLTCKIYSLSIYHCLYLPNHKTIIIGKWNQLPKFKAFKLLFGFYFMLMSLRNSEFNSV